MTITEFYRKFPSEESCKIHLKKSREEVGIQCKKCNNDKHYWLKGKEQWQCSKCNFRTTLRSGTIFEASNLGLKIWFQAIFIVSNTKKGISACELQRQLGLKRYESAWYMMHKIRKIMSRINEEDQIAGKVEIDDAFLVTVDKKSALPPGTGNKRTNQTRKLNSFIMVESIANENRLSNEKYGKIRMLSLEDVESEIIWQLVDHDRIKKSKIDSGIYRCIKVVEPYLSGIKSDICCRNFSVLPWIQTAIGNIRRLIRGIHHHISPTFTQLYFDEFSFKFNYRNHRTKWDLVLKAGVKPDW